VTWLVYGLFAAAVAVLVAAEWPRLLGRLSRAPLVGRYSARKRRRRRERAHLVLWRMTRRMSSPRTGRPSPRAWSGIWSGCRRSTIAT